MTGYERIATYPAAALMVMGLLLLWHGLRLCHAAWPRPWRDLMQPLLWLRGFRATVVGLALTGLGAAWLWQIAWLLALCTVIGLEEALETSVAILALRREPDPA